MDGLSKDNIDTFAQFVGPKGYVYMEGWGLKEMIYEDWFWNKFEILHQVDEMKLSKGVVVKVRSEA